MSNLSVGKKVFILPNEKEKKGDVGTIEKSLQKVTIFNGNKRHSSSYTVNGKVYAEEELLVEGNSIDFKNDDDAIFNRVIEKIDVENKTVTFNDIKEPISAEKVYYCKSCEGFHIFGVDDGAAYSTEPTKDNTIVKEIDAAFRQGFDDGGKAMLALVYDYYSNCDDNNTLLDAVIRDLEFTTIIDAIDELGVDEVFTAIRDYHYNDNNNNDNGNKEPLYTVEDVTKLLNSILGR